MKDYIKLMRVHHWIKNVLILLPCFFAGKLFEKSVFIDIIGVLTFCLCASIVYIINDIKDADKDKKHEVKRNRPIASSRVSKKAALVFAVCLSVMMEVLILVICGNFLNLENLILLIYLSINIAYSFGLKDKPIVDVILLASGFVLRVIFGAVLSNCMISQWFYVTIMMFSLYMGLGKRRNELRKVNDGETRQVLKYYTDGFLSRNMLLCATLGMVFYSFWSAIVVPQKEYMIWTLPLVIAIFMRYELDLEQNNFGDPVDVILSDKLLIGLAFVYGCIVFGLIYLESWL